MENLSLANPILPATLFAVAIASGAVLLIKRHSTTRAQVRECPHCKSIIGSNEEMNEASDQFFTNFKRLIFGVDRILVILGSIFGGAITWQFINRAETAEGVVVNLNAGGSHPEIKFTTRACETIEYPQGGLISGYRTADKVTVYYDPSDPHDYLINSGGALWGFTVMSLALGSVFTLVGLFLKPSKQNRH